MLRNVDPLHPTDSWIQELTAIELAWCRRLHLAADVVAYGWADDRLSRVVLEVEGPGAAACLGI